VARLLLIRRRLRPLVMLGALCAISLIPAACGQYGGAAGDVTTTTALSAATVTQTLQADLTIPDSICLGCHSDFPVLISMEDVKTFSHQIHLAQRIPCIGCHAGAGHAGAMTELDGAVCAGCHGIPMPHPVTFLGTH
jgi:hypothetical protein